MEILCNDLEVPTAFSPNGNGHNDLFSLHGRSSCIVEFYFAVFNRWGEKVFETNDGNALLDGTHNSKLLEPAVFVYYLNATLNNSERVAKKENISLIR